MRELKPSKDSAPPARKDEERFEEWRKGKLERFSPCIGWAKTAFLAALRQKTPAVAPLIEALRYAREYVDDCEEKGEWSARPVLKKIDAALAQAGQLK